jgi:hypothetical protein
MNDAMQLVLAHVFEDGLDVPPRKAWPYPLACTPWKRSADDYFHRTVTLKPHRDKVKAAITNKRAHAQFRLFIEAQIWLNGGDNIFYDAFCTTVQESCFHTWEGKPEASLLTRKFSLRVYDTFFAGVAIATRLTDTPDVYEIVAHYAVGDTATTGPAFVVTVPAVQFQRDQRLSLEESLEKIIWVRDNGCALRAFLEAQHNLRV